MVPLVLSQLMYNDLPTTSTPPPHRAMQRGLSAPGTWTVGFLCVTLARSQRTALCPPRPHHSSLEELLEFESGAAAGCKPNSNRLALI